MVKYRHIEHISKNKRECIFINWHMMKSIKATVLILEVIMVNFGKGKVLAGKT